MHAPNDEDLFNLFTVVALGLCIAYLILGAAGWL